MAIFSGGTDPPPSPRKDGRDKLHYNNVIVTVKLGVQLQWRCVLLPVGHDTVVSVPTPRKKSFPEDGCGTFLRNVYNDLQDCTVS